MKVVIDLPESAMSALRKAPLELADSVRVMAAALWYDRGDLSQERAAELAGQSRQDFIATLSRLGISPCQGVEDDLETVQNSGDSHFQCLPFDHFGQDRPYGRGLWSCRNPLGCVSSGDRNPSKSRSQ